MIPERNPPRVGKLNCFIRVSRLSYNLFALHCINLLAKSCRQNIFEFILNILTAYKYISLYTVFVKMLCTYSQYLLSQIYGSYFYCQTSLIHFNICFCRLHIIVMYNFFYLFTKIRKCLSYNVNCTYVHYYYFIC